MNTITRMLLVPEDRFNDPTNILIRADMPTDRKVRLINNLKIRNKKSEKQDLNAILHSNLSAAQKQKIIDGVYGGAKMKVDTGVQPENQTSDDTTMEFETPKSELSRSDGDTTMLNLDAWTIQDKPETPLIPPQNKSSWSLFDLPSSLMNLKDQLKTPLDPQQVQPMIPSTSQAAKNAPATTRTMTGLLPESKPKSKIDDLEVAIRNIPSLITADNKVMKDDGKVYTRSNLTDIIKYLKSETGAYKKPDGAGYIIEVIRQEKPELLKLIKNPTISRKTEPRTWAEAQKSSDKVTYRRKAEVASEESDDFST